MSSRALPLLLALAVPSSFAAPPQNSGSPILLLDFSGTNKSDPGTSGRPDASIAVGTDHVVELTIGNVSVFDKATGAQLINAANSTIFGTTLLQLNARVEFDPHSQRFFAAVMDSAERMYVAVSSSDDPTGAWFTTSLDSTQGVDAGRNADFLRIGFDADGFYASLLMFETATSVTSTVFAFDKAPLVAPVQSLGAVTAFRDLFHGFGIQPCATYEDSGGEYFVSHGVFSFHVRVYQLSGPLTSPTLNEVGTDFSLQNPSASVAPVPALGSSPDLEVLDYRFQNAVYHDGSIWTTRQSGLSQHSVHWFEVNAATAVVKQFGFVTDPELSFYLPSIAVNSRGDALLSFCASSADELVGTYVAGRHATDADGYTSPAQLLRAGAGPQNPPGAAWGFYGDAVRDPSDPERLWCAGIYARMNNRWGTQLAQYELPCDTPSVYCSTAPNSVGPGALISSSGPPSIAANSFVLRADDCPPQQFGIFYYGLDPTRQAFGDGFRCIGGMTFRLPVTSTSGAGAATWNLDVTDPPQASGQIGAGETWRFQFWYRDPAGPGGSGFNLSDGLLVELCP